MRIACQREGMAKAWNTGVPLTRLRFAVADFADTPAAAAQLRKLIASLARHGRGPPTEA
jgi:hypothetical protein